MTGTVTGPVAGLGLGPPAGTAVPFGHYSPLNSLGVTSSRTLSEVPTPFDWPRTPVTSQTLAPPPCVC